MRNFLWAYVHLEGSDWLVLINKKSDSLLNHFWSGGLDSNQRPPAPHADTLPGCATTRT